MANRTVPVKNRSYQVDGRTVARNAIPDSGMFQSPLYQYSAVAGLTAADGEVANNWTEQLAGTGDATAVGNPLYRADQAGFEAVDYDGTDDGHDFPTDGQLPTGSSPVSFAATIYTRATAQQVVGWYGPSNGGERVAVSLASDGGVSIDISGFKWGTARGGSYSTGTWITIGGATNGSGDLYAFLNGAQVASSTGNNTANLTDSNRHIAYSGTGNYLDGYVYDWIVCAANESEAAFSNYHTDRLG